MISYDKKEHKISYKDKIYNSHDDIDMQLLIDEIDKVLTLKESINCRTSISISDIFDEATELSEIYNILKLPIFCMTIAGDEYGFDILAIGKHGIFLIQNDYFRAGV